MLKTVCKGEERPHILLWEIVEEQANIAEEKEHDWSKPALIAMVFAFHTVEAYINFVGERLAPDIWDDEENYFRRDPYRGWRGKLCKLVELAGLPWRPEVRPLATILELKELRDAIAHAKTESLDSETIHVEDLPVEYPESVLRSRFTPKKRVVTAVEDVLLFANQVHRAATLKVNDPWFGEQALYGPISYTVHETSRYRPK